MMVKIECDEQRKQLRHPPLQRCLDRPDQRDDEQRKRERNEDRLREMEQGNDKNSCRQAADHPAFAHARLALPSASKGALDDGRSVPASIVPVIAQPALSSPIRAASIAYTFNGSALDARCGNLGHAPCMRWRTSAGDCRAARRPVRIHGSRRRAVDALAPDGCTGRDPRPENLQPAPGTRWRTSAGDCRAARRPVRIHGSRRRVADAAAPDGGIRRDPRPENLQPGPGTRWRRFAADRRAVRRPAHARTCRPAGRRAEAYPRPLQYRPTTGRPQADEGRWIGK